MNLILPRKAAILFSDAKREYFPTHQQYFSELEVKERAESIAAILQKTGISIKLIPGDNSVSDRLKAFKPDLVFNLVDSVYGKEYLSATIPATLELLQIPYTGSGMMGQVINSNKYFTKDLLEQYGITTPKYQLIKSVSDEIDPILDYPLIAKLNEVHGSVEIDDSAVCEDERNLNKRISYLMETYQQPVLVEEFVVGREITVLVVEGSNTKVYAGEKIFANKSDRKYQIVSFDDNYSDNSIFYEKYELPLRVKEAVKTAFNILKMEDYAKFDFRLDASGRHYLIDCNSNPALGPNNVAAIGSVLQMYGVSFETLLRRLINNTLSPAQVTTGHL